MLRGCARIFAYMYVSIGIYGSIHLAGDAGFRQHINSRTKKANFSPLSVMHFKFFVARQNSNFDHYEEPGIFFPFSENEKKNTKINIKLPQASIKSNLHVFHANEFTFV